MKKILSILCLALTLIACGDKNNPAGYIAIVSQNIRGGQQADPTITEISITFLKTFNIEKPNGATLNGQKVTLYQKDKALCFAVSLKENSNYQVKIAEGTIMAEDGSVNQAIDFSFTTTQQNTQGATNMDPLCTPSPSKEAQNLYNYLLSQYGNHVISGAIANVNWNCNEAEWVHYHTGKYPAITCFDLIQGTLNENWAISTYAKYDCYENWWANNGIVAGMWHQLVPKSEGVEEVSSNMTYSTKETSFKASNALVEGTWENTFFVADVDRAAEKLKGFRDRNIPVIWRPYHEASGKWFWWGADAESHKAIWIYMWNRFVNHHGLNNLIWVWTSQGGDNNWYPGDQYVDIIGHDIYNKLSINTYSNAFTNSQVAHPKKMITLSECGKNGENNYLAPLGDQWNAGAKWSYFMPWYDPKITRSASEVSIVFTDAERAEQHTHMPISYWKEALALDIVVTRDEVPNLK